MHADQPELFLTEVKAGQIMTVTCRVRFGSRRPDDIAPEEIPDVRVWYDGKTLSGNSEITPGKPGDSNSPATNAYQPSSVSYVSTNREL